jgi:hypothetical protein
MPGTHQKIVTVVPVDDAYGWSVIDDATNSTASWVAAVQQGSTDTWDFTVQDNTSSAPRSATCTVLHSNGVVTDFFTIDQAGTGVQSTPTGSYTSLVGTPSSVDEDGSVVTFTVQGISLQDGTVPYSLSGTGITANDIGGPLGGNISIVNNTGTLNVPILADNITEGNETITCTLAGSDSNGISTGSLNTNVTINDTSLNPTFNYSINWDENATTQTNWTINSSSVTSGTVSNVVSGAQNTSFDGTPGDVIQITLLATAAPGRDFDSVNGNPVISIVSPQTFGLPSENTSLNSGNIAWPDNISWIVEITLPNAGTNVTWNASFNATTVPESTSAIIALHGPLGTSYTCNETSVDITATYDDTLGTLQNPLPAVGDNLTGVSTDGPGDNYLVVAGSGGSATTGSATAHIGMVVSIFETEIFGFNPCNPTSFSGTPSPVGPSPMPSPSPSPTPSGSPGGSQGNMGYTTPPSPTTNN